ncbi:MAG: NAD(P)H-dependent oxidoreductase subunit E [Candidatus Omnitrophica bacterium]|nr:NAD(P)H-dependent oxidoreductase subunit E [Candidatus Omnitrophota bacterium]
MISGDTGILVSEVDELIERVAGADHHVIRILQALQERYQYLPPEALRRVCETTGITPARITGVASFYSQFRFEPVGRHILRVCHGTACHVKGATLLEDSVRRRLGLSPEEHTTGDRLFTLEKVACLGCCTLAPVVQVGNEIYGYLTPEKVPKTLDHYLALQALAGHSPPAPGAASADGSLGEIRIGLGSCCSAKGSGKLRDALQEELRRIGSPVAVKRVGCVGMCHHTPMVEIALPGRSPQLYTQVQPKDATGIVRKHFRPRGFLPTLRRVFRPLHDALADRPPEEPIERHSVDKRDPPVAAFLDCQVHIATEHSGLLNPIDLEEYLEHEGFRALQHCLRELSPEQVIDAITRSGLRGRGGGGFPTGIKWARVRETEADAKYVICNGDEGDPGAFMDRMLLESFPYRIIEGMAIAAYAVGASEGVFYVRAEYPLALRVLREALARLAERGLLGNSIFGTGFSLHLRISEGAGAFVSGEETALLAAVEGRRSTPRLRPPFPAQEGLWGKPTAINNVETYALVPWILRHGAQAFASHGSEKSKGTKVFALAGKVARGGLIEVPMGMTIRRIVEEIGGGIAGGKRFKAVQIGGPSGGCIPAALADTPVDFEALQSVGAIMGSGGMVVLDEQDCMVDIARYFLEFTQNESCGKCTLCRVGSKRMLEILTRLCEGKGKAGDLELLEKLGAEMKKASFCGLGKTAPNPVLTTLKYFREEYEAHLAGRCPAGKCQALIRYSISEDCIGCTLCAAQCPTEAIRSVPYQVHEIDPDKCIRCDMCRTICPEHVVGVR